MKQMTIIHTADSHLDASFSGARHFGYAHTRREDLKKTFSAVIDLVLSERAQALLISGDLFEHEMVSRQTIEWLMRQMNRLSPLPVFIIAGNHDPLVGNSWYIKTDWPLHIHLLSREKPVVKIESLGLQVAGFGFGGSSGGRFDPSAIPPPTEGYLNLLMIHGTLDMAFTGEKYQPVQSSDFLGSGYQAVSMGHFHKPFIKEGTPVIINPGSPEPLGFDEDGEHGAYVSIWEDAVPTIRFVPLALRVYREATVDVTQSSDENALKMTIQSALNGFVPDRDLVRLVLTGRIAQMPDLRSYEQALAENWLLLRLEDKTLPDFDLASILSEQGLRGEFARLIDSRTREARDNKDRSLTEDLERALIFGLEALETGHVPVLTERRTME